MPKSNGFILLLSCGLLGIGAGVFPRTVHAAPAPGQAMGQLKAGRDQPKLEVRREGAAVTAAVCQKTCDWAAAVTFRLEAPFDAVPGAFTPVELGEGRRAAHVVFEAADRRFELVLAAPLSASTADPSAPPAAPLIVFAGETGLTLGQEPDRTGTVVELLPNQDNTQNLVVASIQEDVSLCGRKALLSPRILHAESLSLKGVKLQRLPSAEREAAATLTAEPLGERVASNVLMPLVASSGKGSPAALVDNDASTLWTEHRGGSGGGEFVVLRAPSALGLTGFTFTLPSSPGESYRAPSAFWLATNQQVFRVELPSSSTAAGPTASPGENADAASPTAPARPAEWYVPFPSPVSTSCLAVSLDTATENDGSVDVGFAELGVTTDVDAAKLAGALADLDSGGDRATAAEQLLQAVGRTAFERVQKRYRQYSEAGRMRALNVMDAAPCRASVSTYLQALFNEGTAEAEHGQKGLWRCKSAAVPALARRLPALASERSRLTTNVLVRLDPVAAVDAMAPLLGGGSRAKRRVLQLAFTSAVRDEAAAKRAKALLAEPGLEPRAGVFLLRALGDDVVAHADVAAPRLRQWLSGANFDVRYLGLSPAARLASVDPELERFVLDSLSHAKEPAIRTEAARVVRTQSNSGPAEAQLAPSKSSAALVAAIADPQVRVREAAAVHAGEEALVPARSALEQRVSNDAWPLVRSAAVRALGQLPPEPGTAKVLAAAAKDDDAPSVRRPAIHVLGLQNATTALPTVRDAFEGDDDADVRATAAASLGLMCDRSKTDDLTRAALKFASLTSSENERLIGKASLTALGRLAPPDLEKRLAPFFGPNVPQIAQSTARAALNHPEPCGR